MVVVSLLSRRYRVHGCLSDFLYVIIAMSGSVVTTADEWRPTVDQGVPLGDTFKLIVLLFAVVEFLSEHAGRVVLHDLG